MTDVERDEIDPTIITKRNSIKFGEEVSQDDLGIDDDEWQALVDGAAIRDYAPPDMPKGYLGSPLEFLREQANKREEEEFGLLAAIGGYNVGGANEESMHLQGLIPAEIEAGTGPSEESKPPSGGFGT